MNFKDYRHKANVRAAVFTEEKITLPNALDQQKDLTIGKGDYIELRDGQLYAWAQVAFEERFEPRRAERQAKTRKKREKVKAADA